MFIFILQINYLLKCIKKIQNILLMSLHHLLKSFRKLNRIGDNIIVTNMIIKNIEENKTHQNNDILNDIP